MTVRILLADDHSLVRAGLRRILEAEDDFEVVAEAADGVEAVSAARTTPFDLAVLDVSMPTMTGLQAAREITRRAGHLRQDRRPPPGERAGQARDARPH